MDLSSEHPFVMLYHRLTFVFQQTIIEKWIRSQTLESVLFLSSWAFALHLALQCILDRERENVAGLVSRPLGAQLPTAPS